VGQRKDGTEDGPSRQSAISAVIKKAPSGLYGSSEVQALFSVSDGESRLVSGGVPVNAGAAARDGPGAAAGGRARAAARLHQH
jgi:hypothetical protein